MSESKTTEDMQPLSSIEWSILCVLNGELNRLKVKDRCSNEEQVVLDWMQDRVNTLTERKKNRI